jgi:hypothetical protein
MSRSEPAEGSSAGRPVWSVAAAIFRDPSRRQVLLGVRRTTPMNARHPGVLSTATIRVPAQLFHLLLPDAAVDALPPGTGSVVGPATAGIGVNSFFADPASFVLEHLLCRKLGLVDALAAGTFQARATALNVALDEVADPLGTGAAEWTAMITYAVDVLAGAQEIPASTAYFSRFLWAETALLERAIATRDVLLLDDSLDPVEVCIHGLCVRSAVPFLPGQVVG